jgi:hypothetical protein
VKEQVEQEADLFSVTAAELVDHFELEQQMMIQHL